MTDRQKRPTKQIRVFVDDIHFLDKIANALEKKWGYKPTSAEAMNYILKEALPKSFETHQEVESSILDELDLDEISAHTAVA